MAEQTFAPRRPVATSGVIGMALLLAACSSGAIAPTPTRNAAVTTVAGQLLVKFRPNVDAATRRSLRQASGVASYDALLPDTERWMVTSDVTALCEKLASNASFAYAEANHVRRVQAFVPKERSDTSINQWYLGSPRGINADAAWALPTFANATDSAQPGYGVTIAVVDTGVDTGHPDLAANIATASNGTKLFLDEVGPESSGTTDFTGKDGYGHGTHVAGLVAARGSNGGIVGVAPGATILPVKTMRYDGSGDDATIAKGLKDAADNGADIINLSVGGSDPSQTLASALAYDFSKGVTVVIAAGNQYGAPVYYPAAYPGVIAVGAVTGEAANPTNVAYYSNRGSELTLVAPGGDGSETDASRGIYSTLPSYPFLLSLQGYEGLKYGVLSGTSMATPIVSGVAALVIADAKAHNQRLTPSQVRERLIATARPLAPSGFSTATGYGLVDPVKALQWNTAGGNGP